MKYPLIAFCGFAGCGKDVAAQTLMREGYTRVCFGDAIKAQCDALVREHLGFSAFTPDPVEKQLIRPVLEAWGDANYDHIFQEFFSALRPPAVNTRICRVREAAEWIRRGGIIIEVIRPGVLAETPWALKANEDLHQLQMIHERLLNDGTVEELHHKVRELFL